MVILEANALIIIFNSYINLSFQVNELVEQSEYKNNNLLGKRFSIVIPAYNEENRIKPVLEEIHNFIAGNNLNWDVIVAVDGEDQTLDIVDSFDSQCGFIKSNYSTNREGMGGAIRRGILSSDGDFIILMDADGSTRLQDLVKLVPLLEKYDIVNFDRYSSKENFIPFKRRVSSRIFNVLLRSIFNIKINDTQCGYKLIKRESIEPILKNITVSNAFFLSALFIYSRKMGLNVVEIPIKYNYAHGSKFNVIMTGMSYIVSITAFRLKNSAFFKYIPNFVKNIYYEKLKFL